MGLAYIVSGGGSADFCQAYAMWLNCKSQPTPALMRQMPAQIPSACGACVSCVGFLNSNHSDTFYITGKQSIGVSDVRDLLHHATLTRFGHNYKVFICTHAESLTHAAQNALLKSIEEPEDTVVFLLAASTQTALLPTVISRCVLWRMPDAPHEPSAIAADILKHRGFNAVSAADMWQNFEGKSRPELESFLQDLYDATAKRIVSLAVSGHKPQASWFYPIEAIKRAKLEVEQNANPKLAFLLMLLNF